MSTTRRLPLESFFRKPERVGLTLSPSGRHLAFLAPWQRRLNVHVRDLETGAETRVTEATERDVQGHAWASEERLVFVQDEAGDENYHLYSVGRDGADLKDLTPFPGVKCEVVDPLEDVDDELLIQLNRRDPQVFDVYRVHVGSGEIEEIARNPGNVGSWMTDHQGRLRLAKTTDGVNTSLLHRASESDDWSPVAEYDFKENAEPLLFTFDDRALYVASNVGRDKTAIFEYDLATGKEGRLVHEHPEVDVSRVLYSRLRRVLTGVVYETDRPEHEFFDDRRRRIQQAVDAALPDRRNAIASHSRDESRFIVRSWSDRTRGAYWLLHAGDVDTPVDDMRLEHLFDVSPWLSEGDLAEMRPIRYESRDGQTLHGYLTCPPGRAARNLPLVLHPHGGPWVRDGWGFDPLVQFLVNRGAAVLQVNYRGSTGYGRRFWEAGFGQWGLAMQDDLTDGVRWTIDQGIADPERIAIFGASYGGYAALSGLTKTPELYACGVSWVGVSNLFTWLAAFPPYWKPYLEMVHEMVGHPERDAERLRATSPLFNVDRIRAPLLVAQGAKDPRVKKEESDQIVEALRQRGIPVEYVVKENEGHGFLNEENQFDFFRALESFLTEHLRLDG